MEGELELLFQDENHLKINAGSEWARHPLGKRQPAIASSTALGDVRLLCVNDEFLGIMAQRNQHLSPENTDQETDRHPGNGGRLLNSSLDSLEHFKAWPFMKLPPKNLGELIRRIEAVAAWDGETIIREGEEGNYYYLLEKGSAEVHRLVGGVNMVLAKLKPGDAFGEEALISGAKRNATVTMKSNGLLLRLKQDDFLELMQEPLLHYLRYREAMEKVAGSARWLDVRHPPEYRHDKLSGAICAPLNDIRSAIGVLDKSHQYIICCQDGRRSSVAAFILARAGYDVCVLDGGLQAIAGLRQQ
jgi:rhodanese-related sulfurtransferase